MHPRAALVQQQGTSRLKRPAAAAGHKLAHSKTSVEPEDNGSSRQVVRSLTSCSKRAFWQAMGSLCLTASWLHGTAGLEVAFDCQAVSPAATTCSCALPWQVLVCQPAFFNCLCHRLPGKMSTCGSEQQAPRACWGLLLNNMKVLFCRPTDAG